MPPTPHAPIALDCMGGDHAPGENLKAAVEALEDGLPLLLVGREEVLREHLKRLDGLRHLGHGAEIVHATEVVEMDDPPVTPIKKKKDSSIRKVADLVKAGRAAGFVSPGNTGALVAVASLVVGRIEGVERPALTAVVPGESHPTVMLDMGATPDCRPEHLLQFAEMGEIYAQILFNIGRPRIALMSVGIEDHKGNELTKAAHELLRGSGLDFIGNVEGNDLFRSKADVIVCDGFTGNIMLKTAEGVVTAFKKTLRAEIEKSPARKIGALLMKGAFKGFEKKFDDSEYGGALLLGVDGVCVKAHGKSNAKAIRNAIRVAHRFADAGLLERIAAAARHARKEPAAGQA